MRDVCADFRAELAECNGEPRACPPAGELPAHHAISRLVNSLNGVSSRRLRQEHPDVRQHYWRARRLWSGSCFAGSADGAPISVLRSTPNSKTRRPDRLTSARLHHRPEGRYTGGHLGSETPERLQESPFQGAHMARGRRCWHADRARPEPVVKPACG